MPAQLIVRSLGLQSYLPIFNSMRTFTQQRQADCIDELWLLEHFPVFTQGQAGKAEHLLKTSEIPLVHSDRGGQITFHGPGQLMAYVLLDLKRLQLGIRQLVTALEQVVIVLLQHLNIEAYAKADAPGVYVDHSKICSIGLRVRRGYSYHGLALNYHMDLKPFQFINPCGYAGLAMTQISQYASTCTWAQLQQAFIHTFCRHLGYTSYQTINHLPLELMA